MLLSMSMNHPRSFCKTMQNHTENPRMQCNFRTCIRSIVLCGDKVLFLKMKPTHLNLQGKGAIRHLLRNLTRPNFLNRRHSPGAFTAITTKIGRGGGIQVTSNAMMFVSGNPTRQMSFHVLSFSILSVSLFGQGANLHWRFDSVHLNL